MQADRRAATLQKVQCWLLSLGTVIFLLLLVAGACVLRAAKAGVPPSENRLLLAVAFLFPVYTVYWYVAFVRAFRLPEAGK